MSRVAFRYVVILITSLQSWALTAPSSVKGYQEWKNEKVQYAQSQADLVRTQLLKAKLDSNRKLTDNLEKQIVQLNWNVDVAKDLSVTDYFVLYLSQQTATDRFHQAAQKMSTKEVTELMEAYANTLDTSPSDSIVQPVTPQAAIPAKLPIQAIQAK